MDLLRKSIAELTSKKGYYKTLNTLFRLYSNASKFDTRSLNDIPQKNKRFTKHNVKLCNVSRTVPRKQETPQSNAYEAHLYNKNDGSYGYVSRIRSRNYST